MYKATILETPNEISTRIRSSIILDSKGIPIMVDNVQEGLTVACHELGKRDETVTLSLDKLNLNVPRAGFMNSESGVLWVERFPARFYKAGYSPENTLINRLGSNKERSRNISRNMIDSFSFSKMLLGDYPALSSANFIYVNPFTERSGARGMAVDKDLAIGEDQEVYFKNRMVGRIRGESVVLDSKYSYLNETIDFIMGKVNGKES